MTERSNLPVYERLYGLRNKQNEEKLLPKLKSDKKKSFFVEEAKPKEQLLFQPKIQEKSKKIDRKEKIDNILYDDAIRRNKTSLMMQTPEKPKVIKLTSENTDSLIANRFRKEFLLVISNFTQKFDEKIDYIALCELLKRMDFIPSNENYENEENLLFNEERSLLFELW